MGDDLAVRWIHKNDLTTKPQKVRLPPPLDLRPSRQSASSPDVDLIFKQIFKRWGSVDHKQTFPPGAIVDAARHSPSWATAALQASRSPFISSVPDNLAMI